MILQYIFTLLNTLQLIHWQTHSFAVHKATEQAYSELQDALDQWVETYQGISDERLQINKSVNLDNLKNLEDEEGYLYSSFSSIFQTLLTQLNKLSEDTPELENIVQEIQGIFGNFLYRLTLK